MKLALLLLFISAIIMSVGAGLTRGIVEISYNSELADATLDPAILKVAR